MRLGSVSVKNGGIAGAFTGDTHGALTIRFRTNESVELTVLDVSQDGRSTQSSEHARMSSR